MCRVILLVLFAYCFGPGQFWQMFTSVLIHILLMSVFHFGWSRRLKPDEPICIRMFYNCLINGVGNLYLHNNILMSNEKSKKRQSSESTFKRQIVCDTVFCLENIVMTTVVCLNSGSLGIEYSLVIYTLFCYLLGLGMKWIYYRTLHLWRNSRD